MTPESELCNYCTMLDYDKLPKNVRDFAKLLILDAIGVGIRADSLESSAVVKKGSSEVFSGRPECVVWGTGELQSISYAAFVNATFVHSPELDDTHRQAVIHPGAPIIPTALAVAEYKNSSGKEVIEAIVAGYEVACRLGIAMNNHKVHIDYGFHGTPLCGVFGAAVAAGMLHQFDAKELENLLGIALSTASGSLQYKHNGAWSKRIHPGLAAKDAILATSLAKHGFLGAAESLTGKHGFLEMYGVNADPDKLNTNLGKNFEIVNTAIKPYACCRYIHPMVELTLTIVGEHDIDPEAIKQIDAFTFESAYNLSKPGNRKTHPKNVVDAQFSPQYGIAVAVIDRDVLIDQYSQERMNDPELQTLMQKIKIHEKDGMSNIFPKEWPASVTIKTDSGTYQKSTKFPIGELENPLRKSQVIEKFDSLTSPRLTSKHQRKLTKIILDLENILIEDFSKIMQEI